MMKLQVSYGEDVREVSLEFQTEKQTFTHVDASRAAVTAFGHRKNVRVTDGNKTYIVRPMTVEKVK